MKPMLPPNENNRHTIFDVGNGQEFESEVIIVQVLVRVRIVNSNIIYLFTESLR